MGKNKPPAFQFYPKDWLSDEKVLMMSSAEEGAYIRLLCHAWLNHGLPDDDEKLAHLSRLGPDWHNGSGAKLRECFRKHNNKLQQNRLEKERQKQRQYAKQRSLAGLKSAKLRFQQKNERSTKSQRNCNEKTNSRSTVVQREFNSSSSSSSSIKKEKNPPTPLDKFQEMPYCHGSVMKDRDYQAVVLLRQQLRDEGITPTDEQRFAVNAARVWAPYKYKFRGGMGFRGSEDRIIGFLKDNITIEAMLDTIERHKGLNHTPIWEVFKPLERAAEDGRVRQEADRKASAAREKQKERRKEDERVQKENQELVQEWHIQHPHEVFPGFLDPGFIAWVDKLLVGVEKKEARRGTDD